MLWFWTFKLLTTLISREKLSKKIWVKNLRKCCVFFKIEFLDKNLTFRIVCICNKVPFFNYSHCNTRSWNWPCYVTSQLLSNVHVLKKVKPLWNPNEKHLSSIFQGNLIWIFLNSPTPIPNGEKMSQDRKLGGTTNETGFPLSLGQVVASVYQCLSSSRLPLLRTQSSFSSIFSNASVSRWEMVVVNV